MTIYIPEHLRKLEILDNLVRILETYNETEKPYELTERDLDSFFDYHYYNYTLDPVQAFVSLYVQDEAKLHYYVNRLYSVKGTQKVLELTRKFFFSDDSSIFSYSYEVPDLKVTVGEVKTTDFDTYQKTLTHYLEYLLFFDDYRELFKKVILELSVGIKNRVSTGSFDYSEHTITVI